MDNTSELNEDSVSLRSGPSQTDLPPPYASMFESNISIQSNVFSNGTSLLSQTDNAPVYTRYTDPCNITDMPDTTIGLFN